MRATVTSTATGEVLVESVLVVNTHDGRVGFAVPPADADRVLADPRVTVTGHDTTLTGLAGVVRSGTAYEEVRGRTRTAQTGVGRWFARVRARRASSVVLVRPTL